MSEDLPELEASPIRDELPTKDELASRFRALPRVDRVLLDPLLDDARRRLGDVAKEIVRAVLDEARQAIRAGGEPLDERETASRAAARARSWSARRSRRVINATGVILHTNLGRAPLSSRAVDALSDTSSGYLSLELELDSGERGGRGAFVESALCTLTGAESALVVNNNAAAVLLSLAAIASGRSVLVSRGELVEIGGGFRVPEVLARSGARLVEVGTTNRTRVSDYARALDVTPDAAAILRVHPGNFRQVGFVEHPELSELVELGRDRGVRVVEDLGSGALVDLSAHGLSSDPLPRESIAQGLDLVTFSTDKILGGPQGGVLVGRRDVVDRARRDPLARAVRLGRLPLVALEATLATYLEGDLDAIPALAMVRQSSDAVHRRACSWASVLGPRIAAAVVPARSLSGGGTYAGDDLPSWALALQTDDPQRLAMRLRCGEPAVIVRIERGSVLVDGRTVLEGEDEALLTAIAAAWVEPPSSGELVR